MWLRICFHLGPWIRIQMYKMKGKVECNQHIIKAFLLEFFLKTLNLKKVANI